MTPPSIEPVAADVDSLDLPCAQALLAAVVALMSAYASAAPESGRDLDQHRRLLARKVVSNLFFLRQHPDVPPPLRQVMAHVHQHWSVLAQGPVTAPPPVPGGVLLH